VSTLKAFGRQLERKRPRLVPTAPEIAYSEQKLRSIIAKLPSFVDSRRRKLAPRIIRAWARWQYDKERQRPVSRRERAIARANLRKLNRASEDVIRLLSKLDDYSRWRSAIATVRPTRDHVRDATIGHQAIDLLEQGLQTLSRLAAAAVEKIDRQGSAGSRKGGPEPDTAKQDAVTELAEIFEYLTGQRAERMVRSASHSDYGPFWDFVVGVWNPLYGSTRGLPDRMRNWANWRKHGVAFPSFLRHLSREHPEWEILSARPRS
jgi:hypothetical protein